MVLPALSDGSTGESGDSSTSSPGQHHQRAAATKACRGQAAHTALAAAPGLAPGWPQPPLTHAGHEGHVQLEAIKAVAGVALPDAHAAPVLAAIEDPTLLSLQPFEALVEAWKVARPCQSRVALHPASEGTPGTWQDGAGGARTDSEQPGAELG